MNQINVHHQKANWVKFDLRFFRQCFVGFASHYFPRSQTTGANLQEYFEKQYVEKFDDLIFDGNDNGYFSQMMEQKHLFDSTNILDVGAGNGEFYQFLIDSGIKPKSYLGLDFAVNNGTLGKNAELIRADATDCGINFGDFSNLTLFYSNTGCYLSDNDMKPLLSAAGPNSIVLIEPYPGLFWDKQFSGIRPVYRLPTKMISLLESCNWKISSVSIFYVFERPKYYWPISYCVTAIH